MSVTADGGVFPPDALGVQICGKLEAAPGVEPGSRGARLLRDAAMSPPLPRGLSHVPRPLLEQRLVALEHQRIECPLTELDLTVCGFGWAAQVLADVLTGLDTVAATTVPSVVLAERAYRPPPRFDLVGSGPDVRGSVSRDTAQVVERLFDAAERTVVIGGYAFDQPEILTLLHTAMRDRGVATTLFLDIDGTTASAAQAEAYATAAIDRFFHRIWTFGAPRPDVYYDPRTATPGPPWMSLHAKCIVVDDARTLVTSPRPPAFTERPMTMARPTLDLAQVGTPIRRATAAPSPGRWAHGARTCAKGGAARGDPRGLSS